MKKVKWTAVGQNVWSVRTVNIGAHELIQVSVTNSVTKFNLQVRDDYEVQAVGWKEILKLARVYKTQIMNDPAYTSTSGPRRPRLITMVEAIQLAGKWGRSPVKDALSSLRSLKK